MVTVICSIFDAQAAAFRIPFFMHNEALACRAVMTALADKTHEFSLHCEDFQLYRIGTFDDATGELVPETPKVIATFASLREQASNLYQHAAE